MMKNNIWELEKHISNVWSIHDKKAAAKINRVRLWDKNTPYAVHPIWCATTLLTETRLPQAFRYDGALALLYHDVLEDTSSNVAEHISPKVKGWIKAMTFPGGFEQEKNTLFVRSKYVRLLKLYDKTSNLMDSAWMPQDLLQTYRAFTNRLLLDVRQNFGELNITRIAQTIIEVKA